jgi:glycosyltransferase involved in cell wall biosynthesis
MIRVLVVELAGSLWGSERALLDLIKHLSQMEVAVCCPPERPIIRELENLSVHILPYYVFETHKKSGWHRLWAAIGVLRACIEFQPDVIYLNQVGAYKVALPAATLMNLPVVSHVRMHGDVDHIAKLKPNPNRLRALIAISKAIEQEIKQIDELKSIKTCHVYDLYAPFITHSYQSLITTTKNRNCIACIGRIEPTKGQNILINSLSLPGIFNRKVELLIAGTGEEHYLQELKQYESKLRDCGNSIRWLGTQYNVLPLLQMCSVLAVPSYREGLGRVIFEAWDAGTFPVVFAGAGGAAEIVAACKGGILYSEQTPECLGHALHMALELDTDAVARFVTNGRLWLAKNCDPENYSSVISRILLGACEARRDLP